MNKAAFVMLAAAGLALTPAYADPISPTGDATNVTAAIQAAIDAAPNGIVTLAAGTYPINKTIVISNGASLIGGGTDRGAVVLSLETTATDLDLQSVLRINNSASTVVSNLTVTGKNAWRNNNVMGPDVAVKMNSGIIVDCTFEDCKTKNGALQGGAIKMSGGTVRCCTITRCEAYNSAGYYGPGEAIYMTGGLVENCVMVSNVVSHACNAQDMAGGTVYISGGTLRGCLIADNVAHRNGSGVSAFGGVIENCTIAGNRNFSSDSDACGVWVKGTSVVLRNNIIWGNTAYDGKNANLKLATSATLEYNDTKPVISGGSGNVSVNPMFADPENGDYHIGYSYCSDAGSNQGWMAGAVDLDGSERIINGTVDMGCYESSAPAGFVCAMSISSDEAPDLSTLSLECKYANCPAGTASSASWSFVRQEDGRLVEVNGFSATVQLKAGTWDASLLVIGAGEAYCEVPGAVVVRASRAYANANGGDEFPYDTVEKGSPSISVVLQSLGAGSTLYVAEGHYVISNSLKLVDGGCTRIVSLDGPENTIVRMSDDETFKSDSGTYGLQLLSGSAYVSGLTLVGGRPSDDYTGPMYKTRGLVKVDADGAMATNCVFRDQVSRDRIYESGLSLSAGTVVDCLFTRLESFSSAGAVPQAGIICVKGGVADRIRVEDCIATASGTKAGGQGDVIGVWNTGVMRNSLVTRCSSEHDTPMYVGFTPAYYTKGGCIENCTIVANTNLQTSTESDFWLAAGLAVNGGSVTNCIVVDNWSEFAGVVSNIYNEAGADGIGYTLVDDRQGDASFVTADNHNIAVPAGTNLFRKPGEFTLQSTAPAVNAGFRFDWMAAALDLAGNSRVVGGGPDLGCLEARSMGFSFRLR